MRNETLKKYGGKSRIRACGCLVENNKVLLIRHQGVGKEGFLWAPPGGGVDYHESLEDAVKREFQEETGLEVQVENFLFGNEYMDDNLHAIELFFLVKRISGSLRLGKDPEFSAEGQIMDDIGWFSPDQLEAMNKYQLHNAFWKVNSQTMIEDLKGFFKFDNISIK